MPPGQVGHHDGALRARLELAVAAHDVVDKLDAGAHTEAGGHGLSPHGSASPGTINIMGSPCQHY